MKIPDLYATLEKPVGSFFCPGSKGEVSALATNFLQSQLLFLNKRNKILTTKYIFVMLLNHNVMKSC